MHWGFWSGVVWIASAETAFLKKDFLSLPAWLAANFAFSNANRAVRGYFCETTSETRACFLPLNPWVLWYQILQQILNTLYKQWYSWCDVRYVNVVLQKLKSRNGVFLTFELLGELALSIIRSVRPSTPKTSFFQTAPEKRGMSICTDSNQIYAIEHYGFYWVGSEKIYIFIHNLKTTLLNNWQLSDISHLRGSTHVLI